jgi:putative hydrolase
VGPKVVPSVAEIRSRFQGRRDGSSQLDKTIRRLLGIDLKMKQYAEGSHFVREVVAQAGMEGFNKIWTSPETLPTHGEIKDPPAWIARVVGPAAVAAPESDPPELDAGDLSGDEPGTKPGE